MFARTIFLIVFSLCVIDTEFLSAIEVGSKMNTTDILTLGEVICNGETGAKEKNDYEIFLFYSGLQQSNLASYVRMIRETCQSFSYSEKRIHASIVVVDAKRDIFSNLQLSGLTLVWDKKNDIKKKYMEIETMIPFVVIVEKGSVKWKGNPLELDIVLRQMVNGTFSVETHKKLSAAVLELHQAVQAGLPEVVNRSQDRVLDLQAGNINAVQAKMFYYNGISKFKEQNLFIREQIRKCPDEYQLRIFELDSAINLDDKNLYNMSIQHSWNDFCQKPEFALRIISYAIASAPYAWLQFPETTDIMQKFCDTSKFLNKESRAQIYEFTARTFFLRGDIVSAVKYQTEALKYRNGTDLEKKCMELLQYYKNILKINKAENEK